ncbi:MAG: glycosyltransferase [Bacteroidetes bacterium]|nr:glycosyltransferase [Bacteroidota bacterium]
MAPFGISVIICTHNGVKRIGPTLEALKSQNIPSGLQWEILIIDNGSTDDTGKITENFRDSFQLNVPIRFFHEPLLGKAYALVKGYNESKFELMLICDDDNWLQPDYLHIAAGTFRQNPEIGILGGYGIAEFRGEERPSWFEKWQQCYACGKHHDKTGFLSPGDVTIWGAGSVIRKTLWLFLQENGFHFINNTGPGKPLGEDVELSHAVIYSGTRLYFDDRLWYYHDLSGGRITRENLMKQVKSSGSTLFVIYSIAYKNSPDRKNRYNRSFARMIISLIINLFFQSLKKNNELSRKHLSIQLIELATHRKMYRSIYFDIFPWISHVKGACPLKGTSL